MVLGHILMGVLSGAILLLGSYFRWLPLGQLPSWRQFSWPLAGACLFYLLGQLGMFQALRRTEASRASPLLGLKILILATIYTLVPGDLIRFVVGVEPHAPGLVQWLAVGLSIAAAFLLRDSGPRMSRGAMGWILFACVAYSMSDMHIKGLVTSLSSMGKVPANVTGVCLSYVLCGAIGLAVLPWSPKGHRGDWHYAVPWALSWLAAMFMLFACFDFIDVVGGNIVQSSRGILSILMGSIIAHWGHEHLERKVPRKVFLRRLVAGIVMFLAIAAFSLGSR